MITILVQIFIFDYIKIDYQFILTFNLYTYTIPMDFLPEDIENIIMDYTNEMNIYEMQFVSIDTMLLSQEAMTTLNLNINYLDFKEYFFRKNLQHRIKFHIDIYGNGHPNNSNFWDLDIINDDDSLLHTFTVTEVLASNFTGILYLRFEELKVEEEDILEIEEQMDNSYLIESDDDSEDIEMFMSLI